jgi:hypothetical protein
MKILGTLEAQIKVATSTLIDKSDSFLKKCGINLMLATVRYE